MARVRSARRELIIAALSTAIALIGAIDLIGHPARTVHVLTIFLGGLAAGISLGRAIDRLRGRKAEPTLTAREVSDQHDSR
jgi:hypothetical protein